MVTVTFPWPDTRLSPNGRISWRQRAKLVSATRKMAARLADEQGVNPVTCGTVERVTYHAPSARWDDDNVRAIGKATIDGLADAMGANDRDFHPEVIVGEPRKGGAIVIQINSIPAD